MLGSLCPRRWLVTLYDATSRPARLRKAKVVARSDAEAKREAVSLYPGFEAVAAEELVWREVQL